MDESGIHDDARVCVVAGYVGPIEEWAGFRQDWNGTLDKYKVKRECGFHARLFFRRHLSGKPQHEHYRHLSAEDAENFLGALVGAITGSNLRLIGSAVDVPLFRSLTEDERRYLTGGLHNGRKWTRQGAPTKPYYLPFSHGVIRAGSRTPKSQKVRIVMSRQAQYEMNALELYDLMLAHRKPRLKVGNRLARKMQFSGPVEVVELQAADLICWALHNAATQGLVSGKRISPTPLLRKLLVNLKDKRDLQFFNFEGIMLVLQVLAPHLDSSFPTLDQLTLQPV